MSLENLSTDLAKEFSYNPDYKEILNSELIMDNQFTENLSNDFLVDSYDYNDYDNLFSNQLNELQFDENIISYQNEIAEAEMSTDIDIPDDIAGDMNALSLDMSDILATGGYIGIMEYFKDNPERQKKITNIALAIGAFDTFLEVDGGVAFDFELNPLLIASLAYFIMFKVKKTSNPHVQKYAMKFSKTLSKGMKVIEYGGYTAISAGLLLELSEAGVLGDFFSDFFEYWDGLGAVTDIIEGGIDIFATFGISFALKHLARFIFKKVNKDDVEKIKELEDLTFPKRKLVKYIEAGAPVELMLAPYCETKKKLKL